MTQPYFSMEIPGGRPCPMQRWSAKLMECAADPCRLSHLSAARVDTAMRRDQGSSTSRRGENCEREARHPGETHRSRSIRRPHHVAVAIERRIDVAQLPRCEREHADIAVRAAAAGERQHRPIGRPCQSRGTASRIDQARGRVGRGQVGAPDLSARHPRDTFARGMPPRRCRPAAGRSARDHTRDN